MRPTISVIGLGLATIMGFLHFLCTVWRGLQADWAPGPDGLDDLVARVRTNVGRHGGRQIDHQQALGGPRRSRRASARIRSAAPARAEVAFLEVAAALEAPGHQDAVDAFFEGRQDVLHLDLAGAGRVDDPHVGRVLHALGAGQVGGGVGAVVAAEGDDLGLQARTGGLASGLVASGLRSCGTSIRQEQFVEHGRRPGWSSWCCSVMVRAGHAATQLPQPMHLAPWISAFLQVVDHRAP